MNKKDRDGLRQRAAQQPAHPLSRVRASGTVPEQRNGRGRSAPGDKLRRLKAFTEKARNRKGGVPLHEIIALEERATRDIVELAEQIHRCCSDTKWANCQKRVACRQLIELASLLTGKISFLADEFPEPFRENAEELPYFPCMFPAHPDEVRRLQKKILEDFNLGKRHSFKLRATAGRKTFSFETGVNKLLYDSIHLIALAPELEWHGYGLDGVPLTPENAKQWMGAIWKWLLMKNPNPENDPLLRQLVERPSLRRKRMRYDGTVGGKTQAHNIRAAIKAKLGVYLKRMLNDSAVHK